MEICKNKKTGQAFIHLDEQDNGLALMITPNGDLKALDYALFTEPVEVEDGEGLVARGQITDRQYNLYHKYLQSD